MQERGVLSQFVQHGLCMVSTWLLMHVCHTCRFFHQLVSCIPLRLSMYTSRLRLIGPGFITSITVDVDFSFLNTIREERFLCCAVSVGTLNRKRLHDLPLQSSEYTPPVSINS